MQTIIRRAMRFFGRRKLGIALTLGPGLALVWLLILAGGTRAAPPRQETPTLTPSPSASPSPTGSPSVSPTITTTLITSTPTLTLTPAASPTASPTPQLALSATWTEAPAPTEPFPSPPPAPLEPGPTPTPVGPTPTLIPLPSVTYQFPQATPPGELLVLAQPTADQVLPKGQGPFALRLRPGRGWLLGGVILLWLGLIAWFAMAQFISRRQ